MTAKLWNADGSPIRPLAPCKDCGADEVGSYFARAWCYACGWLEPLTEEMLVREPALYGQDFRHGLLEAILRIRDKFVEDGVASGVIDEDKLRAAIEDAIVAAAPHPVDVVAFVEKKRSPPAQTVPPEQSLPQRISRETREAMVTAIARSAQDDRQMFDAIATPQGDPWHEPGRYRVEYRQSEMCYRVVGCEAHRTHDDAAEARDAVHAALGGPPATRSEISAALERAEIAAADATALRTSLAAVIRIIERECGYLRHEDQEALRQARSVRDGGGR